MNYFEYYDLPIALEVDQVQLKRRFYKKSRDVHPDFHTLASGDHQIKMLEQASFNNEAYKTLADFDSRLKYVLELNDRLKPEGENKVPQAFLMEMMELNEALMELEIDFDSASLDQFNLQIDDYEKIAKSDVASLLKTHNVSEIDDQNWIDLVNYHLKRRYLLRLKQNAAQLDS